MTITSTCPFLPLLRLLPPPPWPPLSRRFFPRSLCSSSPRTASARFPRRRGGEFPPAARAPRADASHPPPRSPRAARARSRTSPPRRAASARSSSIAAFTSLSSFVFRSLSSRCRSSHSSTVAFNSAFRLSRNATSPRASAPPPRSPAASRRSRRSAVERCARVRWRALRLRGEFSLSLVRRSAPVAFFFSASDANPGLGLPSTTWSRGASIVVRLLRRSRAPPSRSPASSAQPRSPRAREAPCRGRRLLRVEVGETTGAKKNTPGLLNLHHRRRQQRLKLRALGDCAKADVQVHVGGLA